MLTRLARDGLVTSLWRHDDGARARRYYSITAAGRTRLRSFRADWLDFVDSVGSVIGPDAAAGSASNGRGAGAG